RAYVFLRSGATWSQESMLSINGGVTWVSISEDTVVIGAGYDAAYAGQAHVFVRTGAAWTEQAKLLASDPTAEGFGISAAINGDKVVVGAWGGPGQNYGQAYVFVRTGTQWSEEAKLTASDGASGDALGSAVAVSGDTVVVAAEMKHSEKGQVYVYV